MGGCGIRTVLGPGADRASGMVGAGADVEIATTVTVVAGRMRIALIFDKARPDATGIYFERACRALGLAYDHCWLRDAPRLAPTYDLYVRVDHGDDYLVELPDHLRPRVFFAIDTHLAHSWKKIRRIASRYDLIFCAQADAANRLRNGAWLPLACDAELHGAREELKEAPRWDVAFVGSEGGVPRKFYLQALRERYPNSFIGGADYTRLGSIYGRARVGFNYSIARELNMRIFEVLAAGTLLVTNAPKGEALSRLGLEERRHFVAYRSPQELFPIIDYYLARAEERQSVAQAGAQVVRARHTYVRRLEHLLMTVSRRLRVAVPPFAPAPREISELHGNPSV